jgi:sirohydrochlorin cobaltochelatase
MGSASLYRDSEGQVPWDKIWTSFCDLAMAGGPPHRGTLLESVDIEKVKQSPEEYRAVVAELRRGIRLASGLDTFESDSLGWVGVQCESEAMAAWLLRAILVENVIVRREGAKLYLPAGPDFRVEREIKNVITSVAKTVHYWKSHLRSRQPPKPL